MDFRPLMDSEQAQALALWQEVFDTPPGFFERYFDSRADPWHQTGDTFGAWQDSRLVSAVHVCRRPALWEGDTVLCGAIANVATLADYRRQGLSQRLLNLAIAHMETSGFHFSLLGTGLPQHYAALGWEATDATRIMLHDVHSEIGMKAGMSPWESPRSLPELYAQSPRPLQFLRPQLYWDHWVTWVYHQAEPRLCLLPERGYLLLALPKDEGEAVAVLEYRAIDRDSECELIQCAALAAQELSVPLELGALPQYLDVDFLGNLGTVIIKTESSSMVRNIILPENKYEALKHAYHSGKAVWWQGDGF